jgi:hypothetical protein
VTSHAAPSLRASGEASASSHRHPLAPAGEDQGSAWKPSLSAQQQQAGRIVQVVIPPAFKSMTVVLSTTREASATQIPVSITVARAINLHIKYDRHLARPTRHVRCEPASTISRHL